MWFFSHVCSFCRGVGRGEGEPDRDRANRKTETPASPQRALPLPAVWESTCDTHQVLHEGPHCSSSPGSARGCSRVQLWTDKSSAAHFLRLCFNMLLARSLSLLGGSAASHYWTRLKLFFRTLTKRWVGENNNWFVICFLALIFFWVL